MTMGAAIACMDPMVNAATATAAVAIVRKRMTLVSFGSIGFEWNRYASPALASADCPSTTAASAGVPHKCNSGANRLNGYPLSRAAPL